jgi:gamma-glutamyltranspeptidase/glutathione hydrolase
MADDDEFVRAFTRNGRLIQVGETWARDEYAAVLQAIGERGPDAFYAGDVAASIVKAVQGRGGVMSLDDLTSELPQGYADADYTPIHREPLSTSFRGHEVFSIPAPGSGAALLGALRTLDSFPLNDPLSAEDEHVTAEAMRLAYGARTALGDPAFVPGLDGVQAAMLRGAADRVQQTTQAPEYYLPVVPAEDGGTSSMAAADESGLVASLTTTVGTAWASRIMVPGTGIVLNDSVLDFTVRGRPNVWGYAPAPANFVAGSRRPLSSMCPYIVTRDGEPVAAGGAAGGATIPSTNIVAVRNMLAYNLGAGESLAQPRIHNQVLPNTTVLERTSHRGRPVVQVPEETVRGLEERGHVIEWKDSESTPRRDESTPSCPTRSATLRWARSRHESGAAPSPLVACG